jgi:hypothetical protein
MAAWLWIQKQSVAVNFGMMLQFAKLLIQGFGICFTYNTISLELFAMLAFK